MPVFQNPTGHSYSLKKKKELIELSIEHNFYIIEDDYISDLYYNEKPTLLKSLDNQGKVFYIKSFSKPFLPGLRMAFLWIPEQYFIKTAQAKYSSDISSSGLSQRALDLFLKKGLWSDYIKSLRGVFYEKWQETQWALSKYMPESVKCYRPQGGYFFWVQLPKGHYAMNLYNKALKKGVLIMPGDIFYVNQRPSECFRLSFAQIQASDIEEGITLLAESVNRLIDNSHGVFHDPDHPPLL
jgi:2-aminoadipate transaminase